MQFNKIGRNDPCICGSGKKYKQCCMQGSTVPTNLSVAKPSQQQIVNAIKTAWANYESGRVDEASLLAIEILKYSPNQADIIHLQGVIALSDGNIKIALQRLHLAVQLNTKHPQMHANLALALHEAGSLNLALKHYQAAIALDPNHANAYFNLHALLLNQVDKNAAITALQRSLAINPHDAEALFMQRVLQPDHEMPANLAGLPVIKAREDAWAYLQSQNKNLNITGSNIQTFEIAFKAANKTGLVLEFGVRHGNTITQIAKLAKQGVHGFDSFEGIPESWALGSKTETKGSYSTNGVLPEVPSNVQLHVGWFDATLPKFLLSTTEPVRLINIDCDIYSSTKTVLDCLAPRIVVGSVLVFDEYIGNEHWREDEFKAFQEAVVQYQWQYEYLCFSFFTKQVAVKIIKIQNTNKFE